MMIGKKKNMLNEILSNYLNIIYPSKGNNNNLVMIT